MKSTVNMTQENPYGHQGTEASQRKPRLKNVMDMTEGKPLGMLLIYTAPLLVGNIFQQLYNTVDSVVVGKYVGANALAAVGVCGSINFLMFALSSGLANAVGIIISQLFGAKKEESISETIANGAYMLTAIAAIISVLGFIFSNQILQIMQTPENLIQDSGVYLRIMCVGLLAVAIYNEVASVLRALGDSRTPLFFLILSSIVNVGLDLLFVLGFSWGVFGVALATLISQIVSAATSLVYAFLRVPYFKFKGEQLKLQPQMIGKIFRIGIPLSLQGSLIAISCMVLQGVVNSFGSTVVATYAVINRIEQLVSQPYMSLGTALSTFTGQNMGAGKVDRVKQGFYVCVKIVLIFSIVLLPLFFFGGKFIMGFFVNEPEVIAMGMTALRVDSIFYFALGMIYMPRSLMNGAGDAAFSMINGVTEVTCRIGYAQIFTRIPKVGYWGIWLTTGITWFTTAIVCLLRYRSGKWKSKAKNVLGDKKEKNVA
jgi:putative MATE family efflux protein